MSRTEAWLGACQLSLQTWVQVHTVAKERKHANKGDEQVLLSKRERERFFIRLTILSWA